MRWSYGGLCVIQSAPSVMKSPLEILKDEEQKETDGGEESVHLSTSRQRDREKRTESEREWG